MRQYATFVAVAQNGGITAAALAIGKAPSAVHYDIKSLEKHLGETLFERIGRSLHLTPAGRSLFTSVDRALNDIKLAEGRLISGRDALPLRLASVSGFGRYQLVPRLLEVFPTDRAFELSFATHEDVLTAVIDGLADFAITYRQVDSALVSSVPIAQEEIVLVAAARHAGISQTYEALTYVTYDEYEYVFSRWFEHAAGPPVRILRSDHCSELEEAMACVAAGRGVSIIPKDAWLNGPYVEDLTALDGVEPCLNMLYLVCTPLRMQSADAALLRGLFDQG